MTTEALIGLTIREGRARDWRLFQRYHYHKGAPAPVSRVWIAESAEGVAVGCVVYAFAGLGCGARKLALAPSLVGGPLRERAARINGDLRVLHRLAVLPEWRGRGVATRLVARTVAALGAPWVECMARATGCLVAAGFHDYGPVPTSREATRLLRVVGECGLGATLISTARACAEARAEGRDAVSAGRAFADELIRAAGRDGGAALLAFLRQFNESRRGRLRGRLRQGAGDAAALAALPAALASLAHRPHYCLWSAHRSIG